MTERGKRLMEIAHSLMGLHNIVTTLSLDAVQVALELKNRESELTPADGWAGSNETTRKSNRLYTLVQDVYWHDMDCREMELKSKLTRYASDISILETERRALEWCIRDEMLAVRYEVDELPTFEQAPE